MTLTYQATSLGFLAGGTSSGAIGVNYDGSVVVGFCVDSGGLTQAVRWDSADNIHLLPVLAVGSTNSVASGVSDNGAIIAGTSQDGFGVQQPVFWTGPSYAITALVPPAGTDQGIVFACSGNGLVKAGYAQLGGGGFNLPAAWIGSAPGILLPLPPGYVYGRAEGVSEDGTVIVGFVQNLDNLWLPVSWSQASAWSVTVLNIMSGGSVPSFTTTNGASECSSNGAVIVGYVVDAGDNSYAAYWSPGAALNILNDPIGGINSNAYGCDATGTYISGNSASGAACLWIDGVGQLLPLFTGAESVDVGFAVAAGASAIVGSGTDSLGRSVAVKWAPAPPPPPTPAVVLPPLCGWRGLTGINWNGLALVGDKFSNVVGLSDFTIFTEYGNPMQLLATAPPLHEDRKRMFVTRFEVEVEAGLGTPGLPEVAPLLVLDYSKDGGVTWVPLQVFRSMGKAGEYIRRLRWINIGNSRTWVFRIQYSGAARPSVIGTYMDFYKALG